MQKPKHLSPQKVFAYLISVFSFWFLIFNSVNTAPLDNIPTDSWIYEAIDYLKTTGYIKSIPPISKPWTRQEVINLLQESNISKTYSNNQAGFYIHRLLSEFADDLQMDIKITKRKPLLKLNYGPGSININLFSRLTYSKFPFPLTPFTYIPFPDNQTGSIGAVFNLDPNSKISLYNRYEMTFYNRKIPDTADPSSLHVPRTRVKSSSNFMTFDLKEAYLSFPFYFMTVEIGRDYLYFGPGFRSSVLLSDNAPSLDHIQLRTATKNFKALWFCAGLSPWYNYHRFLSGQRLEISISNILRLGGTMLVVYSFDSLQTRGFWGYLNPIIPIYMEVANTGHDDNILFGFDFTTYLAKTKIYGQLALDNYEFNTRPERPPNCYGLTLGAYYPYRQFALRTEYSKITRYTYYHRIYHIAYTQYSIPLGHILGPDADEIFCRLEYYPLKTARINFTISKIRYGEGNYGDLDNKTWDGIETPVRNFPSGTIKAKIFIGPEIYFEPHLNFRFLSGVYWNNDKKINSFARFEIRY
ncbi:MAG: capsule assembly Wzi family protein [candidate division WOR-3 bacterium]|nr:capsule assembly Wzi family protein [candidate division WOR-3 bacterium]